MSLVPLSVPSAAIATRRFFLVGYLPTYAGAWFLLALVWAGAPGERFDPAGAWRTMTRLGVGEIVLIALAVILAAVVTAPFQLSLVRFLEGTLPRRPRHGPALRRQRARKRRMAAAALPPQEENPSPGAVQRAGVASTRLRRSFASDDHLLRATALGNILTAMEDTAGRMYGMDAVVVWPRLYPVLGPTTRAVVDDRRDSLDMSARLTATALVVGVTSVFLLLWSGWWLLVALVPLVVAACAYTAALQAALAYSEAVHVAFDLHRFDLLDALRLPRPPDRETEIVGNRALCDLWRQGIEFPLTYRHPEEENGTPGSTPGPRPGPAA
ncbi:hypothetical protein HXS80_21780 [Streptomyces sp. CB04723]|uniref:hypothetical protein n=1 Tax=Streptomyces TaxID=1883 RepID=UPI0015C4209D|nr:hypothetical protein [Streptomyces sp. CB04723]QLG34004.1 hypothetical protein HXS80_21780 [Streptomyces sp. CB04723]